MPVEPKGDGSEGSNDSKEYLMFCFSDNDFITQDGRMNFGEFHFKDAIGYEVDSQVLVFRVTLPQ